MHEAGCLRGLSHQSITGRISWITDSTWSNKKPVTQEDIDNLHNMCDFFLTNKHAFKLCVESSTLRVYTNAVELIEDIEQRKEPHNIKVKQALAINERDVVFLNNPEHTYRTQLRMNKITQDQKLAIKSMIDNSQGGMRPSPGLKIYLNARPRQQINRVPSINSVWAIGRYPPTTPFIDHSDRKWETMISLVVPGIITKTMPIRQRTK